MFIPSKSSSTKSPAAGFGLGDLSCLERLRAERWNDWRDVCWVKIGANAAVLERRARVRRRMNCFAMVIWCNEEENEYIKFEWCGKKIKKFYWIILFCSSIFISNYWWSLIVPNILIPQLDQDQISYVKPPHHDHPFLLLSLSTFRGLPPVSVSYHPAPT